MIDLSDLIKQENLADDMKIVNDDRSKAINWTRQDGYSTKTIKTYPRRSLGAGSLGGFQVILTIQKSDIDYLCSNEAQGYQIHT
jgi:hypothetical protein